MSDPGKQPRVSRPEDDERPDFCPSDEEGESIERADATSGVITRPCVASPPPPEGEEVVGRRSRIHLSDRDRDLFLALLDSDEGPNETLRQAAEAFRRTFG